MGEALSRKIDCPVAGIKFRWIDLRLRARGEGGTSRLGIPRLYVLLSLTDRLNNRLPLRKHHLGHLVTFPVIIGNLVGEIGAPQEKGKEKKYSLITG
jgi:hypothetical protein